MKVLFCLWLLFTNGSVVVFVYQWQCCCCCLPMAMCCCFFLPMAMLLTVQSACLAHADRTTQPQQREGLRQQVRTSVQRRHRSLIATQMEERKKNQGFQINYVFRIQHLEFTNLSQIKGIHVMYIVYQSIDVKHDSARKTFRIRK